MLRRHPVLAVFLFVLLLGGLAISVFLFTFDLNRYRDHLQVQLSRSLSRPVFLGDISFSLRPGLSLKLSDLQIGTTEKGDFAQVHHLFLNTKLGPLLRGEIQVTAIELEKPRFHLNLSGDSPAERELSLPASLGFFESIHVQALNIRDGSILLHDRRDPARPFVVRMDHVDAQFSHLSSGEEGRFKVTGLLQGESRMNGSGSISPRTEDWTAWGIALQLTVDHLSAGPLLTRYAPSGWVATGAVSAEITASGSAASGFDFQSILKSPDLTLRSPVVPHLLAIRTLALNGKWQADGGFQFLSHVQASIDAIEISGNLSLTEKAGEPWLAIELATSPFSLSQVSRLFPDPPPHFAELLYRCLDGTLRVDSARFAGPLIDFSSAGEKLPLERFLIKIEEGEFYLEQTPLRQIAFYAAFQDDVLEVTDGRATLLNSPVRFSGEIFRPFLESREIYLEAEGALPVGALFDLFPKLPGRQVEADGEIDISLMAQGSLGHLQVDLQGDLADAGIAMAGLPIKVPGGAGRIFLTGEITPDHLLLSHGSIAIPPMNMRLRGTIQRNGDQNFGLHIDIPDFDLNQARANIPLLEKLQAKGRVGIHVEWTGVAGQFRREGTILLRDFGIRPTGVIGDISGATGRLILQGTKIGTVEPITARLGKSPVQVEGTWQFDDFDDFRIELLASSMAIWANDLVFSSPRAILRDVEGELTISPDGIDFHTVRVRLDGGTVADVRGRLENFRNPRVVLDIEGDYGNVDEIIRLWERPEGYVPPEKKSGIDVFVLVKAHARKGNLRQFSFQDASAEISHHRGKLDIHPLRFNTGPGFCLGQVTVDTSHAGPGLLKISGHVEQVDAAAVYNQLMHRRGLLSGTLYGDFYLEGHLGETFLATSQGGFNLEIRSGILHKFPFLSKVFSLLNVSQILTFNLPDMSREGMPFRRLAGNIGLNNGILFTEDLFVDSPAMNLSLIGDYHIEEDRLNLLLGVKPLRTVDRIVSKIPLAGWVLTGEDKTLITAHFQITGTGEEPEVLPVPITSISDKFRGIFTRLFGLPGRVWSNMEERRETRTGEE